MTIKDSQIMQTALTKLFPFALLFSIYLFSYVGVFPGGGFQAGVIIGTLVVIVEMALERKLYSDSSFEAAEFTGVLILILLLLGGIFISGYPFGGFYILQGTSRPFANVMIWLLSLAIFLEVAGSMVLIFRGFLTWEHEAKLYMLLPGQAGTEKSKKHDASRKKRELSRITWITACILTAAAAFVLIRYPGLESIFHTEVDAVREITGEFGIRNMVSSVYLGPRVMDTFIEVMVVVLTVFGVRTVRRTT